MGKFKADHLFSLRLLLFYERCMMSALFYEDTLMYFTNKECFDHLRETIRAKGRVAI